ncbi:MAG: phosphoadenylyl-sulfate reductase [Fibrobacter sp.]|nr:phosphoadenylyl-sulfate reductase [Fibrobacter sp.]
METLEKLQSIINDSFTAEEILTAAVQTAGLSKVVLASSLSVEDQALTHMLCKSNVQPRIFTLDTGRLFPETYETMEKTMARYGFRYEILAPDSSELEEMVGTYGPNLFYQSIELRKKCCMVRKINPLKRVLSTADIWICGLRREQAVTRTTIEPVEWDASNNLVKVNPLYNWSEKDVWSFIEKHEIPFNQLQLNGFRSIGCAPCTRAIKDEEDLRAGRWWWEEPEHKECGLHNRPKKN